jgi:hypothetical protein
MAAGPAHVGAAFLILLGYALGAASMALLRTGLDTRRMELRRLRQSRARRGTASPTCAPAQADEHAGAPAMARLPAPHLQTPACDIAAIRIRRARAATQMKLLSFLKDLEAKLRLEQRDPERSAEPKEELRAHPCAMETVSRSSDTFKSKSGRQTLSELPKHVVAGWLTSSSPSEASGHSPVLTGRR